MNIELISAIVFVLLIMFFFVVKKKNVHLQKILFPFLYILMYRTKLGLKLMDTISKKFSKPLKFIGYTAIFIGFLGMLFIAVTLVIGSYNIIVQPKAPPNVGIVQPFVADVPGTVFVPFFYFIISVFILAVVHEFSHGVLAKKYGLHIKSSGFAVMGILAPIIPLAFVEPDEKELKKRSASQQLSIFAAGPFANIVLAFIIILITIFIATPVLSSMANLDGVIITGFIKDDITYPAEAAGITKGEIIKEIDNIKVNALTNFSSMLGSKKPRDIILLKTNKTSYNITLASNPLDKNKSYLGVYVQQKTKIKEDFKKKYGEITPSILIWLSGLLYWLYILNLGIGLFNLVPLGPIDGGRMLQVTLYKFFKKNKADNIWKNISFFFLFLIILNIVLAIAKSAF